MIQSTLKMALSKFTHIGTMLTASCTELDSSQWDFEGLS